ncbi:MAG: phytanoyl-CoA dioxygenase family protein [Paracoccaceae bacterium]|nr:phytanoyl-CoA dioxygenase family protein [Paracoccaceae bacterium]
MNNNLSNNNIASKYTEEGFVAPIEVMTPKETLHLRLDFEDAEAELVNQPEKQALLRSYPNRLLPSFDALTRNSKLIDAASAVLGPDLMVWSAALFIKEKKSTKIVSWHQDLTYWGLDDIQETTCWFALSDASEEAGCMKFVPGTHKSKIVEHIDTFADNNLLTRGQEIAVDVNESEAVVAALQAGQASMHHGLLFHSSGPNQTNDRRIGSAIRYIKPSMKQETGDRSLVTLVNGQDIFKNFKVVDPPKGRLLEEEFELCREDDNLKKKLLF